MREEILAVVSHDLRTPLTAIKMASSALTGGVSGPITPERAQKHAGVIRRASDRMERLIGDLLDMAGIQAGNLSIERTRCEVAPLVSELVESLQPLAAAKRTSVVSDETELGLEVDCDRFRILQVLSNLVGNAIKFTPEGGTVRVAARARGDEVCFSVADTGLGISDEYLPHIFEPYWKGGASSKGTGLGLYIAKGIVEGHRGKIWVESKVGGGTTFFFTLPSAAVFEHAAAF